MSTPLHIERWKRKPYRHQVDDAKSLFDHVFFGLLNEMGTGKTKTTIDAACELAFWGKIDTVLVVAPAGVRGVWVNKDENPDLDGEIHKHSWARNLVFEFHAKDRIVWQDDGEPELYWVVTNYEFIRNVEHRERLEALLKSRKVFMVCDESSFIKDRTTDQTKQCMKLGKRSLKRSLLNGTPGNDPLDLWSQMNWLDGGTKTILPYDNFVAYREEFTQLSHKFGYPKVLGWKNLDKLQRHIAPYVTRREKKDCLDLPPKIYLPPVEVALTAKTWDIYREMRDKCVVWLEKNPSLAQQATTKVMRLMQITSGFLGGVIELGESEDGWELPDEDIPTRTEEVGREKLNFLIDWVQRLLSEKPNLKMISWCWFRPEIERAALELGRLLPVYKIYGQSKTERKEAEDGFKGDAGPGLLLGQQRSGGFGLNLQVADTVAYMSNFHSLIVRQQTEDRTHRSGQTRPVTYQDILAVGPKGQKTFDHQILRHLKEGSDLMTWTTSAWKRALLEE